jgi:hypothetical protein
LGCSQIGAQNQKNDASSTDNFQAEETVIFFVIPSEARNLSSIFAKEKKGRFLASLGMTKVGNYFFRKPALACSRFSPR